MHLSSTWHASRDYLQLIRSAMCSVHTEFLTAACGDCRRKPCLKPRGFTLFQTMMPTPVEKRCVSIFIRTGESRVDSGFFGERTALDRREEEVMLRNLRRL